MDVIIERCRIDSDVDNNTCNHPRDDNDLEVMNLDYKTELSKTLLMNYAHIIGYPIEWSYRFEPNEVSILLKSCDIGMKTGRTFSCNEDLEPLIERFQKNWVEGKWFFRFNSSSPKDGVHSYPIISGKQVIEKICTSVRARNALEDGHNTIYFVKFESNWNSKREFRVFIRKGKVTCISQYNAYEKSILSGKSNNDIKNAADRIVKFLEIEILPKVIPAIKTEDLSADVYLEDNYIRIIELNSFGYWQAAGSALFHWLDDKTKLYNEKGKVWIRIVK